MKSIEELRYFRTFFIIALSLSLIADGDLLLGKSVEPNILLVVTDEHNFRTLSCYRELMPKEQAEMWGPGAVVDTPHFDSIAAGGVICSRAYATSPVCSPCRASMISGLYPHQAGVSANNQVLNENVPTLASLLRDKGYRTGFIGKWHLSGGGKPEWAPERNGGFEHVQYMFNRGHWKKLGLSARGGEVAAKDSQGRPSYAVDRADAKSYATDFLTNRAIEFIEARDDSPFLLVVSYPDPHGPNTVRAPYAQMYDHLRFLPPRTYGVDGLPVPLWLGGPKNHALFRGEQMSQYFGMVKCLDDNFGRLLDTLRTAGIEQNTLIMVTSDHGDLCYEHDRLNKGNPYEGSARVPLLIRFPNGGLDVGAYDQPVATVDITPTLLSLAGYESRVRFEGRDLSEAFRGEPVAPNQMVFLRNAGLSAEWVAAVDARYKLILSVTDRPWLFDSYEDPDELHNYYQRPNTRDITRRLAQGLREYQKASNDPFLQDSKILESLKRCLD